MKLLTILFILMLNINIKAISYNANYSVAQALIFRITNLTHDTK